MTRNYRRVPPYCVLLPYSKVFNSLPLVLASMSALMPDTLQLMKGSPSESLRTHSPGHHKCKTQCPKRSCSEGKRGTWVLAQLWLRCGSAGQVVPVGSTPSTRATEPGRSGFKTSGVTKKPTKQARTLTKSQARRKWGTQRNGCSSLQTNYGH